MEIKPLIAWSDEISLGIQELDEQHKVLVNIINRLYEGIITGREQAVMQQIMAELVQYTMIHFAVEESLQRIFHYPEHEAHRKSHAELTRQVLEAQHRMKQGEAMSKELLNFLRKWLTNHILIEDKAYVPYLLKGGMQAAWSAEGTKSWSGKIWSFIQLKH